VSRFAAALVALLACAAWHAAEAQQPHKVGLVLNGSPTASAPAVAAFRDRMRELGYVEGRNVAIEVRYGDELRHGGALPQRYRGLVSELVALRVDVIVVPNTVATRAAMAVTSTVPIVMASIGNAVGAGLVKSLAMPGGNVTGQSFMGAELNLKELDLLVEVLPRVRRVAALFNPSIATDPAGSPALAAAARSKGVAMHFAPIRQPEDLDLAALGQPRPDAVLVFAVTETQQARIVEFAARHRLPAVYGFREAVDAGGLMSFGPRLTDLWRGAANYADRILKGAAPAALPVEQPSRFELVVNAKTAKALGVAIPAPVLARADAIVE
jgi:putative ABC transport system substrate-binding protein